MKYRFSRQLQWLYLVGATLGVGVCGTPAAANESATTSPAKTLFCAYCHGPDGNPTDNAAPRLAGQDADVLVAKMKGQIEAIGPHEFMLQAFQTGRVMNDRDMKALANYYSRQPVRETVQRANLYLPAK
ncbi:MAG: hypothetical protein R6W97_00610 [Thiobacillus sp.]